MGRISTVAAAYLGLGKKPKPNPRADSTNSTSSNASTTSSPSTPAPPTPPPPPPTTPSHAAPRRLTRTLSFRGGDDVTEALHIELERSLLQVVDVPIEKKKQGKEHVTGSTEPHPSTFSSSSSSNPTSPSPYRFALAKPATSTHHFTQATGEEFYRPSTSLDCTHGPYVLGDGVCHATFSLFPLLEDLSKKSRKTLLQSLLDPSPTRNLEEAGKINWHSECASLVALRTESDGNCLAHAASLGCWGVHDRKLLLRNAVRSFLVEGAKKGPGQAKVSGGKRLLRLIRKSWEEELGKHGVLLEKETLDAEWAGLAKQAENRMMTNGLAATTGSNNDKKEQQQQPQAPQSPSSPQQQQQPPQEKMKDGSFAYLEAAHIYILAHVLRRPLIVFATDWVDAKGRQLASGEEIAGVYLPLELPRHVCSRTPLVLAYDSFHFSPLVPADPSRLSQVPLVTSSAQRDQLLPLPFYAPSERNKPLRTAVLKHYLDCETLADGVLVVKIDDSSATMPGAVGYAASSPFSASSFPADGLLSLLLSNVVEDEEFRQNGTILSQGRSLSRSASASAMAMLASSSSGLGLSSSSSSLASKQRLRGGGGSAVSTPPRPLSLGSFASSSSRNGGSNSLNAQLLQQQQQQRQQRQQQREQREQQMYKSSSCTAMGSRATIPKKSSTSNTTTTTTTNSSSSNSSSSSSSSNSSSSSSTKREQSLVRQLREHKDLVLALEEFLKRSKEAEKEQKQQQQLQQQQQTSTAPSPIMTATTPPTTPLSDPPAHAAEAAAPAPTRPLSHNWLAALPLP